MTPRHCESKTYSPLISDITENSSWSKALVCSEIRQAPLVSHSSFPRPSCLVLQFQLGLKYSRASGLPSWGKEICFWNLGRGVDKALEQMGDPSGRGQEGSCWKTDKFFISKFCPAEDEDWKYA